MYVYNTLYVCKYVWLYKIFVRVCVDDIHCVCVCVHTKYIMCACIHKINSVCICIDLYKIPFVAVSVCAYKIQSVCMCINLCKILYVDVLSFQASINSSPFTNPF